MSAFDDNFAYALVSSSDRTLKITGVNPSKFNLGNPNWGAFPAISSLYAGSTLAYNGYGAPENAFTVIEIANNAFNGRTEFSEGPLVLPETLLRIGDNAFKGVKINGRLSIPGGVTYIGANAFSNTLIDELVVNNETTSDVLSGVVDATRVTDKEIAARTASDTSLNTLKVAKANPTFTGTTTIPAALISAVTISTATINTANVSTNVSTNVTVDYYENNVSEKNKNNRFRVATSSGNLLFIGGVNENISPIEIVLTDGIYRSGTALVNEILSKLNSKNISWLGGSQITWTGTSYDAQSNALKLGYVTNAPGTITDPIIVIRTKFVSNSVSYDSSKLLGAMGTTVGSVYVDGAFALAYGNRSGLNFPQPINLSTPTLTVNGTAKLDGAGTVSSDWTFNANKPRYNAQVLATESYTMSKIKIINGTSILSTVKTLADIASAIDADPDFAANVRTSQMNIIQSIDSIVNVRSTEISTLSSAFSTQVSALQSSNSVISTAISAATPVRVSQIESVSTLLQTTVSGLKSIDTSISTALSETTSKRNSQTMSLNSAISTATSLLQNADTAISTGISTATLNRSLNVSTNSSAWSAQVSGLIVADSALSTSIVNATSARSTAVSSLSSLVSGTVPVLDSADATFSAALSNHTTDRVNSVTSLSNTISAQIAATQAVNAAVLSKISGSASVAPDATTNTIFNLVSINVNDSLTFEKTSGSGSFSNGSKIVITYSATDYLKGTVTSVSGSNVTFTVTFKATSAAEATIYTTTGPFGASTASTSGSHVVPLTSPSFVAGNNFVVTSVTGTLFSSSNTGSYTVSLLDGSNATIATAAHGVSFNTDQTTKTHIFTNAFLPKGVTNLKQKFSHSAGASTQIIVNFTDNNAYITMKGYAVPYNRGSVQIESNGALQSTRISAIEALSTVTLSTIGSLILAKNTNESDLSGNSNARSTFVSSIVSAMSASASSLQSVASTIGSATVVNSSNRNDSVNSLVAQLSTGVSSLSTIVTQISSGLSTQISNRSSQVLNAMTSLVGASPASLDTLFEIATTLDAGPTLYSMISTTETKLTSNVTARSGSVSSTSTSLSVVASSLKITDTSLSVGISTASSDRINRVTSVSSGVSVFISSNQSAQTVLSNGISTTVSSRQADVTSISTSLSGMATALRTADSNVLSTGISQAVSTRQSNVASASVVLSTNVLAAETTNYTLSSGISTEASVRQSNLTSISTSLSGVISTQQSSIGVLNTAFSALNGGINLDNLANVAAVDTAIAQVIGGGVVSSLDTLNEIAVALNNNATLGTTIDSLINGKVNQTDVVSLNNSVQLKANQTDLTQLATLAETKATSSSVTQLQTALTTMETNLNGNVSSEIQSMQSTLTANAEIIGLLSDTIRQVDTLYEYNGFVNADGTINYKVNKLANMVLKSSSLAFVIDANYAITKVTQVIAVQFDPTQISIKYSSRGVEYTLSSISLTNSIYTFNIDSSGTTDYTDNATAIVITANETENRFVPDNSPFTVAKLALSNFAYATPTVQTPYAATTWSDATGKISQAITINFESGVQKLSIDGTIYDVSGTTQKTHTLEYLPGANASSSLTIKALNSPVKMESASLTLTNVYNDYVQHAPPVVVDGSKSITVSGSTYSHVAKYSTTASTVELQTYNMTTTAYTSSDLAVVGGEVSVNLNYEVGQIGQPLFRLKAKTGNGKRFSEFVSVNGEAITFSKPVLSSVSYTTLSAGSHRVTTTYEVHPLASAVKVINPSTAATYISSQAASGGSVTFTIDFTETQVTDNAISLVVMTLANSYGLQSVASDTFVPIGQYDSPTYVDDGSKLINLNTTTTTSSFSLPSIGHGQILTCNINDTFGFYIGGLMHIVYSDTDFVKGNVTAINGNAVTFSVTEVGTNGYFTSYASGTVISGYIYSAKYASLSTSGINIYNPDNSFVRNVTGTSPFAVTKTYGLEKVGQTAFKLSSRDSATKRESALIDVIGEDIPIYSEPVISGQITYGTSGENQTAQMNYIVNHRVETLVALNSDGSALSNISVQQSIVGTTGTTTGTYRTISLTLTFPNSNFNIVVRSFGNIYGKTSVNSQPLTILGLHDKPFKTVGPTYTNVSAGSYTASMTYVVSSSVNSVEIRKASDGTVISGASAIISNGNANVTVPFTDSMSPLEIVVVALTNSFGRENSSVSQTLIKQHSAPTLNGIITYSGNVASMTYNVGSDVTSVQLRKASDNAVLATNAVSGTSVSFSYDFSNITTNIVAVAVANANGRESATSVTKTLLKQYVAPTFNNDITYSGSGIFTASMTYAVESGVTAVSVLNSNLTPLSGASANATVSGGTATISISFTNLLNIVVIAQGNVNGRESVASISNAILPMFSAPTLNGTISYSGNTATSIPAGTTNMVAYRNTSSIYSMTITGDNSIGDGIWGTTIYTDDSNIVKAAMHSGFISHGETKTVYIVILPGQQSYAASTQNSISSNSYGSFAGSYKFSGHLANMTYNVDSGVTALQVRNATDGSVISGPMTSVSGTTATITVPFTERLGIAVVALSNSAGRESAASTTQTLLKQYSAPTLNGTISYSGNTATSIPAGTTNMVAYRNTSSIYSMTITGDNSIGDGIWGTTIYTDDSNIVKAAMHSGFISHGETKTVYIVILPGQQSYAASTQNSISSNSYGSFAGSYKFSGHLANMTYNVDSGVTALQVRNATDGSVISGPMTSVSGTTATITVPFTERLGIAVVALSNSAGRESAASATQTLLKQYSAPTLNGTITYSGSIANMTYNVDSDVTSVQLRKASDNAVLSTHAVSGTSVSISYEFSNVTTNIVVVAMANSNGRESAASTTQTLLKQYSAPTLNDITYSGNTASMTYTLDSGVTSVSALSSKIHSYDRFEFSNSALDKENNMTGVSNGPRGTISIWWEFIDATNGFIWASRAGLTYGEACLMQKIGSNIRIILRNQTVVVGDFVTTSNPISSVGRYHLFASWDLTSGQYHIFINGVQQPLSGSVTTGQTVSYADGITKCGFGAILGNPTIPSLNGYVGLAYINYAEYVNPTTSINKFILNGHPVGLGANGSLPTGNSPIVFLNSGNEINSGHGGNFSKVGTVNLAPALTGGASVITNSVNTTTNTASLVIAYTDSISPVDIKVIALGNSVGRESAASTTQTLLKQYSVPTLNGTITYSGSIANMTYNVDSDVTSVQLRKASDNAVLSTHAVSGTSVSITYDALNEIQIVVVALANSNGRESAASVAQILLKKYSAPTLNGTISYSGNTASMTYTVEPNVTAVKVKLSDSVSYPRFSLSNSTLFTNNLTSVQNGQYGTISIWWEFIDATNGFIWSSRSNMVYGEACVMQKIGSNIRIILRNQTVVVGDFVTTSNPISSVGRYHLFASWDLNAGKYHIFINGGEQELSGNVSTSQTISYATSITGSGFGASMYSPPGEFLNGYVGIAYINYVTYVDPTTSIHKFISKSQPVSLGSDGSLPTGSAPIVFMNSGNGTNSGYGGNFTSYGTVGSAPEISSFALPGGSSITTNSVSGTTATLVISFASVFSFGVIAEGNANGSGSEASTSQTLLTQFAVPVNVSDLKSVVSSVGSTSLYSNSSPTTSITTGTNLLNEPDGSTLSFTFNLTQAYYGRAIIGRYFNVTNWNEYPYIYWALETSTTDSGVGVKFIVNNDYANAFTVISSVSTGINYRVTITTDVTNSKLKFKTINADSGAMIGTELTNTLGSNMSQFLTNNLFVTYVNDYYQYTSLQLEGSVRDIVISRNDSSLQLSEYYLAKAPKLRVFKNDGTQIGSDITTITTVNGTSYFKAVVSYNPSMVGQPVMKVKYISSGSDNRRDSEFSNAVIGVENVDPPTFITPYSATTWDSATQIITQQITVDSKYQGAILQFGLGGYNSSDIAIEGNKLIAHFDASSSSQYTVTGSNVTQWNDRSGNGYNLVPNTTGPTVSTINSLPALNFGGSRGLKTSIDVPKSANVTIFIVVKHSWNIANYGSYVSHGNRDWDWSLRNKAGAGSIVLNSNGDNSNPSVDVANDKTYIFAGRLSTNKRELWRYGGDTASVYQTATGNSNFSGGYTRLMHVGKSENTEIAEASNSTIGEILYYSGSLSDGDVMRNIEYLNNKWSVFTPTTSTVYTNFPGGIANAVVGQSNQFSIIGNNNAVTFNVKYLRSLVGTGSNSITVKTMGTSTKLPSSNVSISNVINDVPQFATPTLNGTITYSGSTANMTYTVASGVTSVQVRNASDSSVVTGVTASVNGTTATIAVPVTDSINIVVVALVNSSARESAASVAQTLIGAFAKPIKASDPVYTTVSTGSYTATMTYTVASGVTSVQVRKSSDNSVVSGVTQSVSGTTATITVPFTDAVAPLNIVVVALANSSGRESAASVAHTLLKTYSAPMLNGTISYSGNTANMTYNVESGVSQVSALRLTDTVYSAHPSVMGQTLRNFPALSIVKTWNFTLSSSTGYALIVNDNESYKRPFCFEVRSDHAVIYNWLQGAQSVVYISNFHTLQRPIQFTVSFDTNNFILRYGNNQIVVYPNYQGISIDALRDAPMLSSVSYNGSVYNYYPNWEMSIAFRSTGNNSQWRALIGEMRTGFIDRGWGVWISSTNNIYFSWNSPTWDTQLTVAQNTDYVLTINKTATSLKMDLFNVGANTTQSNTNTSIAGYLMSTIGPVTCGGWIYSPTETFVGTISYVNVLPSLATARASGTSATLAVPYTNAESPLNIKVIALANSYARESAASATQTILKQFDAPTVNVSYSEHTVGNYTATTATLACTLNSDVSSVKLLKPDLTAISETTLALPSLFVIRSGSSNWRQYIPLQNPGTTDMMGWNPDAQFWDVNLAADNQIAIQFSYFAGYWLNAKRASSGQTFKVNVSNGTEFEFTASQDYPVTSYTGTLNGSLIGGPHHLVVQNDGIAAGIAVSGGVKIMNLGASSGSAFPKVIFVQSIATLPLNVVVVAESNASGRESLASATQILVKYDAPIKAAEPVYAEVSAGSYTATMTYTVTSGVTTLEVRKSSDNSVVSGVTQSVSGTTATITVPFTDAVAPLNIVVVPLANSSGREGPASAVQILKITQLPPELRYAGTFPASYTAIRNTTTGLTTLINGIAVDASANVYISSYTGDRVAGYNENDNLILSIGSTGTENGYFDRPGAVAIDTLGNIVVVDMGNYRIQMFTKDGTHIRSFGSAGSGNGQFQFAYGLTIDSDDNIYVSDVVNNNVQKFTSSGVFVSKFGSAGSGNGQFNAAAGMAIDKSGNIYVVDNGNYRVQVFDSLHNYISKKTFTQKPEQIAIDASEKIFVSFDKHYIEIYDKNWNFVDYFGFKGSGDGQFNYITGLVVDKNGTLLVADRVNNSFKSFGTSPLSAVQPSPPPEQLPKPVLATGPIYENLSGTETVKFTFQMDPSVFAIKLGQYNDTYDRWDPLSIVTPTVSFLHSQSNTTVVVEVPATSFSLGVTAISSYTKSQSETINVSTVEFYSFTDSSGTFRYFNATNLAVGNYASWNSTDNVMFFPNSNENRLVAFRINRTTLPYSETFLSDSIGDTIGGYTYSEARSVIYDSARKLVVLANTGNHSLLMYNFNGSDLGYPFGPIIRSPAAVHFDRSGNILVAINEPYPNAVDALPDQIRTYSASGNYMNTLISTVGTTAGTINKPVSLSVDSVGNIIVGCINGIQIFSSSGVFINRLPNTETFSLSLTTGLTSNGASAAVDPSNDNRIIALNRNDRTLYLFEKDSSGNWYSNKSKKLYGGTAPNVPSFDADGNIYIMDSMSRNASYTQLRRFNLNDFTTSGL